MSKLIPYDLTLADMSIMNLKRWVYETKPIVSMPAGVHVCIGDQRGWMEFASSADDWYSCSVYTYVNSILDFWLELGDPVPRLLGYRAKQPDYELPRHEYF